MSRCVYVYCDTLEKGFVTRLSSDQRLERLYEQINEVFLTSSDYELVNVALADKPISVEWILPPFLRMKDLQFEEPIYTKAIIRKKSTAGNSPLNGVSTVIKSPEHVRTKEDTAAAEDQETEVQQKTKQSKKEMHRSTKKTPVVSPSKLQPPPQPQSTEKPLSPSSPMITSPKKVTTEVDTKSKKRNAKAKTGVGKMTIQKTNEPPPKKQKLKQGTLQMDKDNEQQRQQTPKEVPVQSIPIAASESSEKSSSVSREEEPSSSSSSESD
eukprot:g1635.t1